MLGFIVIANVDIWNEIGNPNIAGFLTAYGSFQQPNP